MNKLWDRIIENYKIARECLVYSKKKDCWIRQEDKGMYREFDSCLQFFTNQIAQNVDYINAFEFFLLSNL